MVIIAKESEFVVSGERSLDREGFEGEAVSGAVKIGYGDSQLETVHVGVGGADVLRASAQEN